MFVEYDARYVFYYPDARGKHRSNDWRNITEGLVPHTKNQKEQRLRPIILYEQDTPPVFRCLRENYLGKETC